MCVNLDQLFHPSSAIHSRIMLSLPLYSDLDYRTYKYPLLQTVHRLVSYVFYFLERWGDLSMLLKRMGDSNLQAAAIRTNKYIGRDRDMERQSFDERKG
mmetsp:Transcript_19093/g.18346  ORF Transcript_19093/g.18346 Transcript_19093/m.18346 type:complete len:99 (+) Transcript_19093:15-311(+)